MPSFWRSKKESSRFRRILLEKWETIKEYEMKDVQKIPIAIIGMGAAGSMAAIEAGKVMPVQLFDGNEKLGKKIYITGKGRCNLTNACPMTDFLKGYSRNGKFLYSALHAFSNRDLIHFFENQGMKTKVERGDRVFPLSGHSSDVNKILEKTLIKEGVFLNKYHHLRSVEKDRKGFFLEFERRTKAGLEQVLLRADQLILSCGGKSYPSTGSRGEGYEFAKALGHQINPIFPALCPMILDAPWLTDVEGLSLTNISLKAKKGKKKEVLFGDLLFTREGISGPVVLTMSSILSGQNLRAYSFSIDWKPSLNEEKLKRRLERERENGPNRKLQTLFSSFLPRSAVPLFIQLGGFNKDLPFHNWSKEGQMRFITLLKNFPLPVMGLSDMNQAIITRGGVECKEIDPSTMESKICPGLYFAGEMIDFDGFTGGYNLQAAFSTGFLAGKSAGEKWTKNKGEKDEGNSH